ncbi:LacI family transcriptional regulator, partial [Corynebacterium propinquum]
MLKVLITCVWLLGAAYETMAQAASVVFLNPGLSTETFWVSYAQFLQAAAKDLGLDLRVRYSERDTRNTLAQAREALQGAERPDYLVLVNEQYVAPQILRMAQGSGVKLLLVNNALTADQAQMLGSGVNWLGSMVSNDEQAGY